MLTEYLLYVAVCVIKLIVQTGFEHIHMEQYFVLHPPAAFSFLFADHNFNVVGMVLDFISTEQSGVNPPL